MDWLAENWLWVLFGIAFIAMHFFGHGGHGSHGGHGDHMGGRKSEHGSTNDDGMDHREHDQH